jgi:hypothetical protein
MYCTVLILDFGMDFGAEDMGRKESEFLSKSDGCTNGWMDLGSRKLCTKHVIRFEVDESPPDSISYTKDGKDSYSALTASPFPS